MILKSRKLPYSLTSHVVLEYISKLKLTISFSIYRYLFSPNPELNATQKWWAAFMGDRAFARARAAGKNETEAGHARAKAEADIALSLPAENRD